VEDDFRTLRVQVEDLTAGSSGRISLSIQSELFFNAEGSAVFHGCRLKKYARGTGHTVFDTRGAKREGRLQLARISFCMTGRKQTVK